MKKENKILVLGGTGLIGSAIKRIRNDNLIEFIGSSLYDLTSLESAISAIRNSNANIIIHLAGKVGGVKSNKKNIADYYLYNNLINTNVLEAARQNKVKKVVSLLSTCIYPNNITLPMKEEDLHKGEPHTSNYGYAYAKRMLEVQSRAYREQYGCNFVTLIPTNVYGPNDNFDLENGHVIPSLIRKFWEAVLRGKREVVLWGDGSPLRQFTYSEDIAKIILWALESYDNPSPMNIGSEDEYSIREIAETIADIMGYYQEIIWDDSQPNGQYKKTVSMDKMYDASFDKYLTPMRQGLNKTCEWFKSNYPKNIRGIE